MTAVIDRVRDLTAGVISMLEDATGRRVYDFNVPRPEGSDPLELDHPYAVLYTISIRYGSEGLGLVSPDQDVEVTYQVDGVSNARHRVEWMADRVRVAVLDRDDQGSPVTTIEVGGGWVVNDRRPVAGSYGIDKNGQVYWAHERFRFFATIE